MYYYLFLVKERKDVFQGFKGKDQLWQVIEWASVMWCIFFPLVLVIQLLLIIFSIDAEIPPHLWMALDGVWLVIVGGKAYLETRQNGENNKG